MASLNIDQWSPEEVSQWIKGLGSQFENFYKSFVDEEITGKALLTINGDYLKELSIESTSDQNVVLEAVNCLHEVDTCLHGETVHGQVVVVNEKTTALIEQLENEGNKGMENVETTESSIKMAGQVYQMAKKLLSWLIRSPFSEMNACWPLKDSVCRVVRDMTDESLLKNFGYLLENLKKLQVSLDNFLNKKEMHEVFKQPPILTTEVITLEGEGLGIGITTSHNIHTVNSVSAESPAGKNKNIKNGDEIVKVNDQCVIAWQQKNVVTLMKSKSDSVSLTLKKLPLVDGPLNEPVDKPGTPLSEMEVIMDRTRITNERTARVEMKEAGIKEETSLEMQAIENEEENLNIEKSIEEEPESEDKEAVNETAEKDEQIVEDEKVDGEKQDEVGKKVEEKQEDEKPKEEENKVDEKEVKEQKEEVNEMVKEKEKEVNKKTDEKLNELEVVKEEEKEKVLKNGEAKISVITEEEVKTEMPKIVENLLKTDRTTEKETAADETQVKETPVGETKVEAPQVKEEKTKEMEEKKDEIKETTKPVVDAETETKEEKPAIVNGETQNSTEKPKQEVVKEENKMKENEEKKPEAEESKTIWYDGEVTTEEKKTLEDDAKDATKTPVSTDVPATENVPSSQQNGETEPPPPTIRVEPIKGSPDKKPPRPELPKMKISSVKTVTVRGADTKEVELFSSNVVRREKKVNGAPNKRISCIELGEADCEGWLTKKSGGHGLTPTRWRRQWCVLKEEHLYYYKTSFDREAGGVFEITGYNVSNAIELKKPFAFKCEKENAKKYFFHADNEHDRDMWVRLLNAASRGEKEQKTLGIDLNDGGERKSNLGIKPQNRGRTSSVLAGIRFNYYDEDIKEDRPKSQEVVSKRAQDNSDNKEKHEKEDASDNILKVAKPVDEIKDASQLTVVTDGKGSQGTTEDSLEQKGTSDVQKSEGTKDTVVTTSESTEAENTIDVEAESKDNENKTDSNGQLGTSEVTNNPEEKSSADDGTKEDKSDTKEQNGESEIKDAEALESKDNSKSSDGTSGDKGETKTILETGGDKEGSQGNPKGAEGQTDEFKEIAKSIQEADINIDGSERPSPKEKLRKLSMNSKGEIMDKVVRLRLLKQSLKDKEQSMDVIDELLSSDVTPETISEWRTKFDNVVEQTSDDVNENSQS